MGWGALTSGEIEIHTGSRQPLHNRSRTLREKPRRTISRLYQQSYFTIIREPHLRILSKRYR